MSFEDQQEEGPTHPKFAAAVLMVGIVIFLILVSLASIL